MFPMVTEFINYGQQTKRAARYIGQGFMITLSHANRGDTIRKKEEINRMEKSNRAFAHFRSSRSEKNQDNKKVSELIDRFLETNKKETKDET